MADKRGADSQLSDEDQGPSQHQERRRQKNKDENPQEFEEIGSQEVAIPINAPETAPIPAPNLAPNLASPRNEDSMESDRNLQFNVMMGQSINDSVVNKSDS